MQTTETFYEWLTYIQLELYPHHKEYIHISTYNYNVYLLICVYFIERETSEKIN